jgi:hypothetical protein
MHNTTIVSHDLDCQRPIPWTLAMMRFISILLLVAFLFASTHSIVDHRAGGHKSSVWLSHGHDLSIQPGTHHPQTHDAHHHDPAALHFHSADAHDADSHTHFTPASFPRGGSTLLPLFLALTGLIGMPGYASAQNTFFCDDPFGRPPRSRPLYLHCRTLLI